MAYSKIILNGETLMDVTSDTVGAESLLNGKTATKNDGTKVSGGIINRNSGDIYEEQSGSDFNIITSPGYYSESAIHTLPLNDSDDLTVSGATVTVNAGYYHDYYSKTIATGSAFSPAVTITKNPTINVNTSGVVTASYNGSSSITPTVTSGYVSKGTAGTISTTGTSTYQLTSKAAATYYPSTADQTIASQRWLVGNQTIKSVTTSNLTADNIVEGIEVQVGDSSNTSRITQVIGTYAPTISSVTVTPTETTQTFNTSLVDGYKPVTVNAISSTYVGTGIARKSSADTTFASTTGTFTAPVGYYSAAATKTLTTQAAQTIYPSTADQTISSYRWLTGSQTIKSVTTSNLTAENIAEGVVVKVGDSSNASRITQVTGTHKSATQYTATITNAGNSTNVYVIYNNTKYYTVNNSFTYEAGDVLHIYIRKYNSSHMSTELIVNGETVVKNTDGSTIEYDYVLPNGNVEIYLYYGYSPYNQVIISEPIIPSGTLETTSNDIVNVYGYSQAKVANEYYGIYKALAMGQSVYTSGSTTYSYTSEDVTNYCNSLSVIASNQFIGRDFCPSGITFDNVTEIYSSAFGSIWQSTTAGNFIGKLIYSFPKLSSMHENVFYGNQQLKEIYAPLCSTIGSNAFQDCLSLTTANFSSCLWIHDYAFSNCKKLTTVSFPVCKYIDRGAFCSCKELTSVNFPSCTSIGSYAFSNCSSLTTISFPACTNIYSGVFSNCIVLSIASFPVCSDLGPGAFNGCTNLSIANFPVCTNIANYAFYACSSLTTVSFPVCTNIGSYAFCSCAKLTTVSFSVCKYIGQYTFSACKELTSVNFPSCISIAGYAFSNCSALTTVSFPSCTNISNYAFCFCTELTTVSLPICTSFGSYAFRYCYNLISLYLNSVSAIPTFGTNMFSSTPISTYSTSAGRYGSIFVPASLFESFKTATGWAAYSARMVSV